MALTTYNELKTSVGDWLNRSDLTTAIPDFISLAEAQIERNLRTRQMLLRSTATIDTEYAAVPDDFLEVKSFKLNTSPPTPLQFETIDSMDNLSTIYTSSTKPAYFSVVGGQFRFLPIPDSSYTSELTYYAKVYLYGALMQAAPYLQDDARITTWASLYKTGLEEVKQADDRGATSGGTLITRARTLG